MVKTCACCVPARGLTKTSGWCRLYTDRDVLCLTLYRVFLARRRTINIQTIGAKMPRHPWSSQLPPGALPNDKDFDGQEGTVLIDRGRPMRCGGIISEILQDMGLKQSDGHKPLGSNNPANHEP